MNEGEWNEGFVRLKSGMERRRMKENSTLFVCAFEVDERRRMEERFVRLNEVWNGMKE